jgi:ABC-type transport system involved in cytochrome bd biosynthesis fused ATPase/permease subunit
MVPKDAADRRVGSPLRSPVRFFVDCRMLFRADAGQTGLGKSTLINTIFASHLIDSKGRLEADEPIRNTTDIHPVSHGESR